MDDTTTPHYKYPMVMLEDADCFIGHLTAVVTQDAAAVAAPHTAVAAHPDVTMMEGMHIDAMDSPYDNLTTHN